MTEPGISGRPATESRGVACMKKLNKKKRKKSSRTTMEVLVVIIILMQGFLI